MTDKELSPKNIHLFFEQMKPFEMKNVLSIGDGDQKFVNSNLIHSYMKKCARRLSHQELEVLMEEADLIPDAEGNISYKVFSRFMTGFLYDPIRSGSRNMSRSQSNPKLSGSRMVEKVEEMDTDRDVERINMDVEVDKLA